jgi:hydrogenase maturation protease
MTARPPAELGTSAAPMAIEVLVCGSEDRGDDAAAIVAARDLEGRLPAGVQMRVVGQLTVEDLLAVPVGGAVVVVDAAAGISPGSVVDLPINSLGRLRDCRPRSSHSLEAREVIALAAFLRGAPLNGRIVVIGGDRFDLGSALGPRVASAIPDLVAAVLETISELRRV